MDPDQDYERCRHSSSTASGALEARLPFRGGQLICFVTRYPTIDSVMSSSLPLLVKSCSSLTSTNKDEKEYTFVVYLKYFKCPALCFD